ncbi:TetR/AcrR family transcriptional regulator [Thermodesulfobacteriota bacterium]
MNNYNKILKAATRLMSEKGYHGTSIQMISDEVGVTKSTIIHHFMNKEGILLAILKEFVPSATEEIKEITKDKALNGIDKLKKFLQSHMHAVEEHRAVLNLYLRESRYFSVSQRRIYKKNGRAYANQVEDIIKQIQRENKEVFKGLIPKVVANSILGMVNYATVWYQRRGKLDEDQMAEHFYKIVIGEI